MKKKIGWLHLWLGLSSGLVVFIVALTGSLMVFEEEIDSFINPEFYNVPSIGTSKKSLDYCISVLEKDYSIKKISRISTWDDKSRTIVITGKNKDKESQIFSMDPYTGKVLGTVLYRDRFFSIVLSLHRELLLGDIGKIITGVSCLIFVFLLLSGLILWWPKKVQNLRQRLTVKWNSSFKRVNWDFHSTFGFYSFLFLLIIALTGLVWSFDWFEKGLYFLADGAVKKVSLKVENPTKIDPKLDQKSFYQNIYNKTDSIFPYKGNIQIRIPSDTINSIQVLKEHLDISIPDQSSAVYFDKYTGENIEIRPYASFSRGDTVKRLVYPIHTGSVFGYPTKIIAFFVTLFALTLPITGLIIWLGRKKKKSNSKIV
ncbi:PepSY-associated TM helix domain-containing protein [Flavobacterium hungaricum]|uniref:PepSY-associated TM helix domain-containing protein n=1 Tax=Flavobacterium hungaricum TaxID=2082725 RepID=UPI001D15663B|nr:PepSY-associated TM helix domain-containing protein [Flavobacterium hungaricum]